MPSATFPLFLLFTSMLLSSCAMKVAPTGGPQDRTPAMVTEIEPPSGTRNMTEDRITFSFDDYVDRSVRNAFVIQPTTRFSTSYAGNEVDVVFEEPLRPNTTYVVTLGTDYRDVRGNTPSEAVAMVFSTGPDLDSGRITGTVTAPSTKGLEVFLYASADALPASFDPRTAKPDYRLPIGASGSFQVGGLKDGIYRVIIVRDENKNTTLDANEDFVFAPEDVGVISGAAYPLSLLLGPSLADSERDSIRDTARDSVRDTERDSARDTERDSIRLPLKDSLRDSLKDSLENQLPGTLSGTFSDSLDLKGPYLLRLRNTTGAVIRTAVLPANGPFALDSIPPGQYSLDVVIDRNGNSRYDHGTPAPYQPGEQWFPMQGAITIRSRWSTEDVKVVLRGR
jgi:uncharacterized protein (DUF2141 family)